MMTFDEGSPTGFAAAKPYDGAGEGDFGATLWRWSKAAATAPGDAVTQAAALGDLYRAAERQTMLVETASARQAALEDWYDEAARLAREETGVHLDNPLDRNTAEIARRIGRGEFRSFADPALDELIAGRQDAFLARLRELRDGGKPGSRLAGLDLDTPVPVQAARRAAAADATLAKEWARDDLNPWAQLGASFAGQTVGSRRDPTFWISMLAGGASRGASALARIGKAALTGGATNAGQSAISQPAIQSWRAEVGLPAGAAEAAQSVAAAAAVGAGAGAAFKGLGEGLAAAFRRVGTGAAPDAGVPAAAAAEAAPGPAERGAAAFDAANEATLRAPETVPPAEARSGFAEALAHLENPDHPPPVDPPALARAADDAPARAAIEGADGPAQAAGALREAGAVAAAMASDDPELRMAGRLATLDAPVLAQVEAGALDPAMAAAVAGATGAPERQAALAALILEQKPQSVLEARTMIADAQAAAAAIDSAQARTGAARRPGRPQSLLQFLAGEGLRDDPEIRAITDGRGRNAFIPGRGALIRRQGGRSLDQALRAAIDAGYLYDPGEHGRGPRELSLSDLLNAIDDELRGTRRYAMGDDIALQAEADAAFAREENARFRREEKDLARALKPIIRDIKKAIGVSDGQEPVDEAIWRRAARLIHEGEETDHLRAFDRAAGEIEAGTIAAGDAFAGRAGLADDPEWRQTARSEADDAIPWDSLPDDSGAASRPGEPAGAGGAPDGAGRPRDGGAAGDAAPESGGRDRGVEGGEGAAARNRPVAVEADDLLDAAPVDPGDGTIRHFSRETAEAFEPPEQALADLVRACKD